MTAQEPFHNFFSRTGGSPLRRVVLVALVDDLDLLADADRVRLQAPPALTMP
jgi:hypothetical protein